MRRREEGGQVQRDSDEHERVSFGIWAERTRTCAWLQIQIVSWTRMCGERRVKFLAQGASEAADGGSKTVLHTLT